MAGPTRKAKEPYRPKGIYQSIGRRFPRSLRAEVAKQLAYAGQRLDPEAWLGTVVSASLLVGIAATLVVYNLLVYVDPFLMFSAFLGGSIVTMVGIYTHLSAQIEDRKNRIERILPDALHIVSANIRAGMTPLVALRMAARPEFGPLEEEIKYATARSLGTESLTDIFRGMSEHIPSAIFARSVSLLAASLKGGGKLVSLLDRLAEDIRELQELKSDLITNTSLYVLFIVFTVVIGTPLLLAVSLHFTNLVADLQAQPTSTGEQLAGAGLALVIKAPLSQDFVSMASIVVMVVTSLIASALIGAIREGQEFSGLKYAPFLIIVSLIVFYVMRDVVLRYLRASG